MRQTRETIEPHLAERVCWQAARREDSPGSRGGCIRSKWSMGCTGWTKAPCWMTASTSCASWEGET